jgi:hypothetical protein
VRRGSLFQSTSDTEVIIHLIATSQFGTVIDRLVDALRQVEGAYSLVALTKDIADRRARPARRAAAGARQARRCLDAGRRRPARSTSSAPSSCAMSSPGEIVIIDAGLQSIKPFGRRKAALLRLRIHLFRPARQRGRRAQRLRGAQAHRPELARESRSMPMSSCRCRIPACPAAIGYAQEAALPFELGIIRNHYVGRTFIEPTDQIRHLGVKLKHNANRADLEGKRVILVDDSIVRGTTSTKIVEMVRNAGAAKCICASPARRPRIPASTASPRRSATSSPRKLLAAIGVDSLATVDGRDGATPTRRFCDRRRQPGKVSVSIDGLYRAKMGDERPAATPPIHRVIIAAAAIAMPASPAISPYPIPLRGDRHRRAGLGAARAAHSGIFGRRRVRQRDRLPRRAFRTRKGFMASWQWASQGLTGACRLRLWRGAGQQPHPGPALSWGWRVPFFFGLLIGPVGLYIRSRMAETPEFAAAEHTDAPIRTLLPSIRARC